MGFGGPPPYQKLPTLSDFKTTLRAEVKSDPGAVLPWPTPEDRPW